MDKGVEDFSTNIDTNKTVLIEKAINFSSLNKKDVIDVGNLSDLWATNIKEPMFVIENIRINSSKIERLGKTNNILRFAVGDFVFIKKFLSKEFYETITMKDSVAFGSVNLKIDAICKFKTNEWNDKQYPQLEIIDAISCKEETTFNDIF